MARSSLENVVSADVSAIREEEARLRWAFPGHLEAYMVRTVVHGRSEVH